MRETEKRSTPLAKTLRRALTEAELIVWSQLNKRAQRGVRFRRQHPVGPYVADFACVAAKLIVELDGSTHRSDEAISHDQRRSGYLAAQGWLVIRFTNDEVYRQLGKVLDGIWTAVDARLR
ncbi:hypothetical protein sos41_33760 [Alphaproteobacteria bacterium SO-S41]|nr:hypothetical protein sos41_33760 [Alphaproteobacteria bacterium SO-S41]